ncbi:MAG: hypothetical protein ABIP33_06340 [Pseudolysinimonas sp.]
MTQYPTAVDREGDVWTNNAQAPLFCLAAGCRNRPPADERILVAAVDADEPVVPRWVIEGSDLCAWHAAQLGRVLIDLSTLHADVEKALIRRSPSGADDPRVQTSGLRDVGDFWNPTAARVLADLRGWAHNLVEVVLTDRPVPEPDVHVFERVDTTFAVDGTRQVTISHSQPYEVNTWSIGLSLDDSPRLQLAGLARHHSRWLALYPHLGADILAEGLAHRRHAIKAVDARAYRRVVLPGKRCSVIVEHEEFGDIYCHGQLVGVLQDDQPSAVVCSTDPAHVIVREDWMAHAS